MYVVCDMYYMKVFSQEKRRMSRDKLSISKINLVFQSIIRDDREDKNIWLLKQGL